MPQPRAGEGKALGHVQLIRTTADRVRFALAQREDTRKA